MSSLEGKRDGRFSRETRRGQTRHSPQEDARPSELAGMSRHGRGSLRPALERDGPDDHLVVDGSQGGADEGADPEDPLPRHKSVRVRGSAIACEGDVIAGPCPGR